MGGESNSFHSLPNPAEGQNNIQSASTWLSPALLSSCHLSPAERVAVQLPLSTSPCYWRQHGSCREPWNGCQVFPLIHKHTISFDTLLMRLQKIMNISLCEKKKDMWKKYLSIVEEPRRNYINELLHRVLSSEPSDNEDYIWQGVQVLMSRLRTKATVNSMEGLHDQIWLFQKDELLK